CLLLRKELSFRLSVLRCWLQSFFIPLILVIGSIIAYNSSFYHRKISLSTTFWEKYRLFLCGKADEKIPARAASVYSGRLERREKILGFQSPEGRVSRSASRTETEER